jgi:hypothetical protein
MVEKMEGGLSLRVTIDNGSGGSLLFNAANIAEQFSIRSGEGLISVSIDKTMHVAPGERVAFVLTLPEMSGEGAVLVWSFESYRVMIGL